MAERKDFEFEGSASPAEAAAALSRIAEGIRARALSLSLGDDGISVYPSGDLSLEVEATEKKDKARIEIAVAWRHSKHDTDEKKS